MRNLATVIDEMLAAIPKEDFPAIRHKLEYVRDWLPFLPPEAQSAGWNLIVHEMDYLWRAKTVNAVEQKLIVIFKGEPES